VFNTWRICSSVNLFFIVRDPLGYSLSRTLTFLWTSFWGAGQTQACLSLMALDFFDQTPQGKRLKNDDGLKYRLQRCKRQDQSWH